MSYHLISCWNFVEDVLKNFREVTVGFYDGVENYKKAAKKFEKEKCYF